MAMSVATWSLRERAVWSLPPTGPTISVSRRSTAMWMSSSPASNRNEPPVEADRGVELAEDGVLRLGEARHTRIMPRMDLVVRSARPADPADGLLFLSAAPYYAAYAGGA